MIEGDNLTVSTAGDSLPFAVLLLDMFVLYNSWGKDRGLAFSTLWAIVVPFIHSALDAEWLKPVSKV
jgi:hypothetical protein